MPQNRALEKIVGEKDVLNDVAVLEAYSSDSSFVPRMRPGCVVKPATAAQVQDLIKWANETLTPLVAVSSGPPHFRGDTVPGMGGSVIMDLSGMKKIIRIDPKNRVAMVEPGVTFGELQLELAKAGLSAYMPLCPRISKLVMTSMLERESITMPALAQSLRLSVEEMGVYIQPIVQWTSCHFEFDICYDRTDVAQAERVRSLVTDGARDLANGGAFFSRPYGPWADIANNRAAETNVLQRKVKKIFDPNNVLNPGRLCF